MTMLSPAPSARTAKPWARSLGKLLIRFAGWSLALGLVALNAWWWWEARPIPDLKAVAAWIGTPRNDEAETVLRRSLRQSPHDGETLYLLARTLGAKGDTRGFAEHAHNVPFWSPRKPEALYGEGLAWLEIHSAHRAEQAFRQYLSEDPNHPEMAHPNHAQIEERLLNLYALEDRWSDARAMISRAIESAGPTGRRIWLIQLMRTYLERSEPAAAVVALREYLQADPEDWDAQLALARATASLKLDDESDRAFAAVFAAQPTNPHAWGDRPRSPPGPQRPGSLRQSLGRGPAGGRHRGSSLVRPRAIPRKSLHARGPRPSKARRFRVSLPPRGAAAPL